jgi:hypothetical protein
MSTPFCHFATWHIAWDDLTICYLHFPPFTALFQFILLAVSVTHYSALLHAGSRSPAIIFWASVEQSKFNAMTNPSHFWHQMPCFWLSTGFGLVTGFIDHFWIITTSNYNSLQKLHTPNITVTTAHIKSSLHSLTSNWALFQLTGCPKPSQL